MKRLLVWMLLFPMGLIGWAQQPPHCGTDEAADAFRYAHPEMEAAEAASLREYIQYIQNGSSRATATYVIPTVVHVIQTTPNEVISDARILSQIEVMNEDFRALNADTSDIPSYFKAGDSDVEFCLATIDPNGCPTNGIVRVVSPLSNHFQNQSTQLKGLSQWDPYRYLNVWLVESIENGGILGYATGPQQLSFAPQLDGVVIDQAYFGRGPEVPFSSYDLGRTGTHEVGHWLGLAHTFQGGCAGTGPITCLTSGDNICDTPPTADPNYGCPNPQNTCTESPDDMMDQTMNFMDYADDACLLMFSEGQGDRMHFVLDNIRTQLWSSGNMTSTGCDGTISPGCSPTADFRVEGQVICLGDSIQFTDISQGPPTSYQWTFTVGNFTTTATGPQPMVTFPTAGGVTVKLVVSNSFGTDSLTETNVLRVEWPQTPPLVEDFETNGTIPGNWWTSDGDLQGTWESTDAASSQGNESVYIQNFGGSYTGLSDNLYSPPIDFSNTLEASLIWDYAYKRFDSFRRDSLLVEVSSDCGKTWQTEWVRFGTGLATSPGVSVSAPFVPGASDWGSDTLDLSDYLGNNGVTIRWRFIGLGGQDLYLDHVRMNVLVGRTEPTLPAYSLTTISPFRDALDLRIDAEKGGEIEVALVDAVGKMVWENQDMKLLPGTNAWRLEGTEIQQLPAGIYWLRVRGEAGQAVRKVVKL